METLRTAKGHVFRKDARRSTQTEVAPTLSLLASSWVVQQYLEALGMLETTVEEFAGKILIRQQRSPRIHSKYNG